MKTVEEILGKEVVDEWFEHPVTGWLATVIEDRANLAITNRANTFCPGEPNKTHERISRFNGAADELNALFGALNDRWSEGEICPLNYLVPEDDYE